MKITTNNHLRDIVYGFELSAEQRSEFDYYTDGELDDNEFFIYHDWVYDISQFLRLDSTPGWDGGMSETAFSSILIKFPIDDTGDVDTEHIIVGSAFS